MGNYNLKNIMLGIGIGVVFSSMINISMSNKELTVDEIKMEALKHNLIVLSKEEIINNGMPEEETEVASNQTPAPETTTPEQKSTPNKVQDASEKITVEVVSGMSSETIADLLLEKGAIDETKGFLKRLGELDMDDKLKVGNYEIPRGSSYDDIIKLMTK